MFPIHPMQQGWVNEMGPRMQRIALKDMIRDVRSGMRGVRPKSEDEEEEEEDKHRKAIKAGTEIALTAMSRIFGAPPPQSQPRPVLAPPPAPPPPPPPPPAMGGGAVNQGAPQVNVARAGDILNRIGPYSGGGYYV
jgi:hypothetical protein